MKPEFWIKAWEDNKRGFHMDVPNPDLVEYAHAVFGGSGRILVPLCGATHDLQWLVDNGYEAVGVELSEIAVKELADREDLNCAEGARFTKERVTLLHSDIFHLTPACIGPITGIWDRAALVALHPEQRQPYVNKLRELLGSGTLFLNSLDYDATKADGPPWSVDPDTVSHLWPEAERFHTDLLPPMPRFKAAGITTLTSSLYRADIAS